MIGKEIFDLLYTHLEERPVNNLCDQLDFDADYQEAKTKECELNQQYENLNLPKEQCKIIEQWAESITARNAAYSAVVFRMGMQCCYSLMMQLANLK